MKKHHLNHCCHIKCSLHFCLYYIGHFSTKAFHCVIILRQNSHESQTEDESSPSAKISNLPTTQPNASEKVELTANTEEEEKHDSTEKHIAAEKGLPEEESVNRLLDANEQPDEPSDTEEERDPTTTTFDQAGRAGNEKDSSFVPDQDITQSTLEPTDLSNVDVCAQELGTAEDEARDKEETAVVVDQEIMKSDVEKKPEVKEPAGVFSYGLADVDAFAPEVVARERTMEGATAEDDAIEEDGSKKKPEEPTLLSVLSETETPEDNQQEAEDQAKTTNQKEEKHTSGEIHEQLTHVEGGLDGNVIPKVDGLVEVSFEDVPDAQQVKEFKNRLPKEEDSVEDFQTDVIITQPEEEAKDVAVLASDQNISVTQDHDENEIGGVEKEVNSEGEEMENQQEAPTMKKKVDANDTNLNDEDNEKGEGVKSTSSSHQLPSKAEAESPEYKHEGTRQIQEGEYQRNESNAPDCKENTTDTVRGDKEDIHEEGYSEVEDQEIINGGGAENHSPQVTLSNSSTAAVEAESETSEANAEHVPEENEESPRTLVESQREDTGTEKEATSKERTSEAEGLAEEGKIDSEYTEEKSDAMFDEGSVSADLPPAVHQGEERPLGPIKDTTEPEGDTSDEVKFVAF